jgi:hypothetical protein
MATLMLGNGADLRFIQEILGHEKISTTQIYAHVSIRQLKLVFEHTHPAEQQPERAAANENGIGSAQRAILPHAKAKLQLRTPFASEPT